MKAVTLGIRAGCILFCSIILVKGLTPLLLEVHTRVGDELLAIRVGSCLGCTELLIFSVALRDLEFNKTHGRVPPLSRHRSPPQRDSPR